MKLKAINVAIVAIGLNLPLATIAASTESQATDFVSQKTDLSQPNQSDSAILTWANSKAIAMFTYNYKNYRGEIQKVSEFFTDSGRTKFIKSLGDSRNLDTVKRKQLTVTAVVTGAPVILQKGVLDNVYSWQVQMPMTVTYKSSSAYTQQKNIVTMLIKRTSSVNAPTGVAIDQLVVGPASGENNSNTTDQ